MKKLIKGSVMKKKLLVLLIALASTMMPNIASAIAIDVGGHCIIAVGYDCY
jgi:hypothetical protein